MSDDTITITITLPWAVLVPDNEKYTVAKRTGRLILTPRYREAKGTAYLIARSQIRGGPIDGPIRLRAVLYEPDRSRARDVANYCKMVHDSLEGAAYLKDSQLDRVAWDRGDVDARNPRVELTLSRISE